MMEVYDRCTNECGTGSYARMKGHMMAFVQQESAQMFPAAADAVEAALMRMCRDLENEMANKADDIFQRMRNDYMRVLGGVQVAHNGMTKPERSLRAEILELTKVSDP